MHELFFFLRESTKAVPTIPVSVTPYQGCTYEKKVFKEGEILHELSNKRCENCFCIERRVQCTPLACAPPLQDCEPVITPGNCCPSSYNCSNTTNNPKIKFQKNDVQLRSTDKPMISQDDEYILRTKDHETRNEMTNLNLQTYVYEDKTTQINEGRSNREMISDKRSSEKEGHKILPCNISMKQEESAVVSTLKTDSEKTTQEITDTTPATTITTTLITTESNELTTTTSTFPTTTTLFNDLYENETTTEKTTMKLDTTTGLSTTVTPIPTTTNEMEQFETTEKMMNVETSTKCTTETTHVNDMNIMNDTHIQERIVPTDSPVHLSSAFTDDVITLGLETDLDIERTRITTEQSNVPISLQTDSTFMTLIPTTVIMPEELDVVNITLHKNLSIIERENTSTTVNGSLLPVRAIPPEIEAILNITQKKDEDYDYDYNEPSLPPSLPGVRIIPFVAADAVVEEKNSPTIYPKDKHHPTDSPIFYKVSHPNLFSPPIETEGGFIPREPILDGPFYESKFDVPYHTTGINIPSGHLPLDITTGTVLPQAITIPPKNDDERCLSDAREYRHGEILLQTDPCLRCMCYYGEVLCQSTKCPPLKPGCRRLRHKDHRSCCGRIVCGDSGESPTVVLDGAGAGLGVGVGVGVGVGATGAPLLGPVVPPITVADGVVTPDPFRDVIRTEEAPDLPALIGDIMPYLLEQRRTATTQHASPATPALVPLTPGATPSPAPVPASEPASEPATAVPTVATSVVAPTHDAVTSTGQPPNVEISTITSAGIATSTSTTSTTATVDIETAVVTPVTTAPIAKKPPTTTMTTTTSREPDMAASKNDFDPDEDDGSFSLDSVLQFLFPGDSTTKASTTKKTKTTTTIKTIVLSPTISTVSQNSSTNSTAVGDMNRGNFSLDIPTLNSTQHLLEIFNISLDVDTGGSSSSSTLGPTTAGGGVGANALGELPADPGAASGLLKLAGCNIYGRMYRVGRIISELSGPCLECMCTEVGVQCRALDC